MTQSRLGLCARWTKGSRLLMVGLVFLGGLFSVSSVQATGLVEAYLLAEENDPTFQSAYFQKSAVQEIRKQAVARLLPTLIGSAGYTQTSQDIVSSDNTVFGAGKTDYDTTSYSLTLTQPIFHWESIVGLKQSKIELSRADIEYVLAQQELILRVASLYLDALAKRDQVDFAKVEQLAVDKHFELASGRYEMGLSPITDLHDAKSRMATIRARTSEVQNQLDDAFQALEEATGAAVTTLNMLQTEIPLVSPEPAEIESWIAGALKQNLILELQVLTVEVANQEVKRQQSGHYPTLDLVGRYSNEETDGSLFGGGSDVDTTEIMLQFNLPLYQGGGISSRVREAKQQANIARQGLVREQRGVTRQVRAAYHGVNSALSRIDALRQSVVSSQLALEAKQEGFLAGLFTGLTVLDAERDLSLISIDYAQARYDYIFNSLKLKQAVGTLAVADLVELELWFAQP